jgi:aminoglycoside phosphotransferase (APT) family kinase protein
MIAVCRVESGSAHATQGRESGIGDDLSDESHPSETDRHPRAIKGIRPEAVDAWFDAHVPGAKSPLEFELIAGGHSNLTYRVTDAAGKVFVLRRPPTGAVIATAHDMAREHRIVAALAGTDVPVPTALGLCEDVDVNDAPFYVMGFVDGIVLVDPAQTGRLVPKENRAKLGDDVVRVLAALHRIDPDAVGLGDLGRKEAYLERQLKRWRGQWEKTKTRELSAMEEAYDGLTRLMPQQVGACIVHGDYRLGNMLVSPEGQVKAVLDWELCTLGDPLADLGYIMNNWAESGETGPEGQGAAAWPTSCGGFHTRRQFIDAYEAATGRDASLIDYYRAFQYWRLAAIVEGVLSRYLKGVMGNAANTDVFKAQVDGLAQSAVTLLEQLETRIEA